MHNPIDKLLSRLDKVTAKKAAKSGLNQWQALCPSHPDKTPSLTITECSDGTVLVKCWTGCTANEIVSAIGLELKDLFIQRSNQPTNSYSANKKLPSKTAVEHEKLIIQIANAQQNKGHVLTSADNQRYQQAKQRLRFLNTAVKL